jgi:hypothetical protein
LPQGNSNGRAVRPGTDAENCPVAEKEGRIPLAIWYYEEIVKNHPGSFEAKAAADRLKALGR